MNVYQVFQQLNRYIDEDDNTFVDGDDRSVWLEMAYNEFREHVVGVAPEIFMKRATITMDNSNEYDLANPPVGGLTLLGANATERLYRLYRISVENADGSVSRYLQPIANPMAFSNQDTSVGNGWTLTGTRLLTSGRSSADLRLEYVPMSTVDWTKTLASDNEFIDDLTPFHSLIALMAAQYYQVADAAANSVLDRQMQMRLSKLDEYLAQERTPEGAHYVEGRVDDWYDY